MIGTMPCALSWLAFIVDESHSAAIVPKHRHVALLAGQELPAPEAAIHGSCKTVDCRAEFENENGDAKDGCEAGECVLPEPCYVHNPDVPVGCDSGQVPYPYVARELFKGHTFVLDCLALLS